MSYLFDANNDTATGTFTSTYADPVTMACFVKVIAHPAIIKTIFTLGNSSSSVDNSYTLRTNTTVDIWDALSRSTVNGFASATVNADGIWVGLVGVFSSDTLRNMYVKSTAFTAQDTSNIAVPDVLQFIRLGETFTGVNDFGGKIAEVAIWNSALSLTDIDAYLRQLRRASSIGPAVPIGYWPLDTNNASQANQGSDAGGTLTMSGAVYDFDHPPLFKAPPQLGRVFVMP